MVTHHAAPEEDIMLRTLAKTVVLLAIPVLAWGSNASAAPEPTVQELLEKAKTCEDFDCPPLAALIRSGPSLWPDLEWGLAVERDELVRFWTLGVMSEVKIEAARPLLETLLSGDKLVRIRAAAAYALGNMGGAAAKGPLLAALKDKDVNVRFEAVSALGRMRVKNAGKPLRKMLRDKDADVRAAAIDALGLLKEQASFDAVVRRLGGDPAAVVRGHAAVALGNTSRAEAVAPLIARLTAEKDADALSAACWALGELKPKSALTSLEALTKHRHPKVAKHASDAIAAIKANPDLAPKKATK
ncbi:MAG: HEAT repeat protein [Myxococcota bacterium]